MSLPGTYHARVPIGPHSLPCGATVREVETLEELRAWAWRARAEVRHVATTPEGQWVYAAHTERESRTCTAESWMVRIYGQYDEEGLPMAWFHAGFQT